MNNYKNYVNSSIAFLIFSYCILRVISQYIKKGGIQIIKDKHNIRHFVIEAISIPIVYNHFGDHDPYGKMYV